MGRVRAYMAFGGTLELAAPVFMKEATQIAAVTSVAIVSKA